MDAPVANVGGVEHALVLMLEQDGGHGRGADRAGKGLAALPVSDNVGATSHLRQLRSK